MWTRHSPRVSGRLRAIPVVVAVALTGACFSGAPTPPPDDFQVDCATDAQPPAGSGQAVIRIQNFAFAPQELSVAAGTEVIWVNCEGAGGAAHTATSDDELWDSGLLAPDGAQYRHTFDDAGSFAYHCTPHPFMQGTVVVE